MQIPNWVLEQLNGNTFFPNVAERTIELLGVLQEYMENRSSNGAAGPRAQELYQHFFVGERARFSDESVDNKRAFMAEMTFVDPDDASQRIFATWHGKIQTPQFRIQFEWPVPVGQERLKVLYIGPKITK